MRARYPGPVGGDNPVSPVELFGPVPIWDSLFGHDGGRCHEDTGATQGLTPRESVIAGSTMEESRVRQVSSERRWSTRMGARGHEFRGVSKVYNLCRV